MQTLKTINLILAGVFFLCYAYQFFYIPTALLRSPRPHGPARKHRFAVLICARNEQTVLADLLQSLKNQTYDPSCMTVFVMADNCTDGTAALARQQGAVVYERHNLQQVGKGYALEQLLRCIRTDYPAGFDGYFVFDADNVLRPDYIEQMNRTFSDGYEVVTSYRNSKNYGDNWISAGYALWFLRESRYLNGARHLLGVSCAVSGTGFLFSRAVLEQAGGWPFHLLTEDIEFSAWNIIRGTRIGFCRDAMLYDEQPVTFRQSWRQRMRWARGYLQVFARHGRGLARGALAGHFSCFDMMMNIMPAVVLTAASLGVYGGMVALGLLHGSGVLLALRGLAGLAGGMYGTLFVLGAITTATEWRKIRATTGKKLLYTLTFPLFMLTYIPISFAALFRRVEWKPIVHTVRADDCLPELTGRGRLSA